MSTCVQAAIRRADPGEHAVRNLFEVNEAEAAAT